MSGISGTIAAGEFPMNRSHFSEKQSIKILIIDLTA